jgi:hypothetical protein
MPENFISQWDKKELITYNYACDVTLSVYPHAPGKLEKYAWPPWPGIFFKLARCGYTLRGTSQASYSPEYITPAQKKNHDLQLVLTHLKQAFS